ncbi:MAG: DUF3108 domain-containing protein [Bacteroidia bacterium]|nr:DUF3108 domain-containing protein [Bacteroidia bacterium]MCF8425636.1 DUF3108 domain-containing protein [Bacteroidia bacterium]MCF8446536.1 DUF3108 domain-containing protein [Bacteroidia bacterium]
MKNKIIFSFLIAFAGVLLSANALDGPKVNKAREAVPYEIKKINNTAFTYGEKLRYRIHYGPLTGGHCEFEVEPKSVEVNKRKAYHIKVKGKSAGMVEVMYKVRDEYESFVDEDAIIPWKCIKKVKEGGYTDSDFIMFDQVNGFATSRRGKVDIFQQTQDVVSAIYFARSTDMTKAKIGDVFPVNFYMDGENYQLQFKFAGRETIKTDVGTFRTLVIKPQLIKGRVFKEDEALTLWVTDDANKIPLLVESDIFVGSIKAELIGYDNLKNPMLAKVN